MLVGQAASESRILAIPDPSMARFRVAMLLLVAVSGSRPLSAHENWPQFRGPAADGVSDAVDLPPNFGEDKNIAWKTPIHGRGWSSPVVWGDQIWITTAPEDGSENDAICVDLQTGGIKHDLKLWKVAEPQFIHSKNSYASPTPAIEAGRVYVHFGAHGTAAIDTAAGKKIWERRDLPCDHFRGPASSPIIVDDLLILTFDGFDLQYLVALNKHTGENVWKRDRNITSYDPNEGDFKKAYSTPKVAMLAGRRQMISPSAGATIAYDPATGDELWRVRSGGMNAAAPPLITADGLVLCTTGFSGFQLFAAKPDGKGDVTDTHVAWQFKKAVPERPSPILVDSLLYMVNDSGILSCVDPKTGKSLRQKRVGGNFSASPVYADGKIYCFDEGGKSYVIKPTRDLEVMATNQLDDGCMASPAVAGRSLIVRTITHLYRIENRPSP
jgi:outer membrane protein assembly factor BamB